MVSGAAHAFINGRLRVSSFTSMRPHLRWSLGITLVLTAAALLWPEPNPQVTAGAARQTTSSAQNVSSVADASSAPTPDAPAKPLPMAFPQHDWTPARFDPFAGVQPTAPPAAKPAQPVAIAPAPVPTPTAPPLTYRYLGQMKDPAGQQWVYLARADNHIPVKAGTTLEEGYVVESISPDAIALRYPALNTLASIAIPPSSPAQ